jgi:hypothetical protein
MNRASGTIARFDLRRTISIVGLWLSILAGCEGSPTSPSDTAVVTFSVASETFRVQLVGDRQIDAARPLKLADPREFRTGGLFPGAGVNSGWSWHLEDVEFVEALSSCATVALAAP